MLSRHWKKQKDKEYLTPNKSYNMFDLILNQIKTRQDADTLSTEIDLLLRGIYDSQGSGFDSILRTKVRSRFSSSLKEIFSKDLSLDKKSFLEGLKNELKDLEEVNLNLAFEPTEDSLDRFSTFVKNEIGSNAIINLSYDPAIIGGSIIVYKGNYRDFSFKRVFEKVFEKERENILKMLDSNSGLVSTRESTQDKTGI